MSIKVLMVTSNLRASNGVASYAMNYYRNLDPAKVQMDFAVLAKRDSPYINEIENRGGNIFVLPSIHHPVKHIAACQKILSNGKYQVVHDNSLLQTLPLMWCAKRMGVPVRILHSHSSKMGETPKKESRNEFLLPLLKKQCNVNFACSELAGRAMFGVAPFIVIPNAIDIKKYAPNTEIREHVRKSLGANGKYVVGSVGRLSPQKNPFFAMDVFSELTRILPNTEYWWIGTGIIDEDVKKYAQNKSGIDKIRFLGERNDVAELYQGMDLFFMPSNFEGLPVTSIEAQAAGLPCVLSDVITRELVCSDFVQYVPLEKGAETWAKILAETLQGKKTQYNAERLKKFDIRCCAHNLLDEYERALELCD